MRVSVSFGLQVSRFWSRNSESWFQEGVSRGGFKKEFRERVSRGECFIQSLSFCQIKPFAHRAAGPLSSEDGTYMTVKTRLWPLLSGKGHQKRNRELQRRNIGYQKRQRELHFKLFLATKRKVQRRRGGACFIQRLSFCRFPETAPTPICGTTFRASNRSQAPTPSCCRVKLAHGRQSQGDIDDSQGQMLALALRPNSHRNVLIHPEPQSRRGSA